jgi:signal transduction histidine kinase
MGLNLVRQMIRDMQGEIDVASGPGGGTTFRVTFPRHA